MPPKIWSVSEDGSIQYVSISKELLPGAQDFMRNCFFKTENISVGTDLPLHPEAVLELDQVVLDIIKAGISIVAVEKSTKRIVGASLNKTQANYEDNFYTKYIETVKHPSAKGFLKSVSKAESQFDFFEHCNVDCIGEIMLLGVAQSHRKRGIATKLCEVTIDIFSKLFKGENVVQPAFETNFIDVKPTPKILTALFTSFITQKIGKELGFILMKKVSAEELMFNGRSINSTTGNNTPEYTLEYIKL